MEDYRYVSEQAGGSEIEWPTTSSIDTMPKNPKDVEKCWTKHRQIFG
jgi:hypothetical protein